MHLFFLLLTQSSLSRANCSEAFDSMSIDQRLDELEQTIKDKNIDDFSEQLATFNNDLPCLVAPLTLIQAGRYHLSRGIYFWIQRNPEEAEIHFAASRHINPDQSISEDMFPLGHEIHSHFEDAIGGYEPLRMRHSKSQSFYFDGVEGRFYPKGQPTLFQVEEEGKIIHSSLLETSADLPDFVLNNQDFLFQKGIPVHKVLYLTAVGLGAGAVFFYTGALKTKSEHADMLVAAQAAQQSNDLSMRTEDNIKHATDMYTKNQAQLNSSWVISAAALGVAGSGFYIQKTK
ncbi:MAG: hypothetical protein CMK59_12955 [Proteobacteria bacterium]|nr:hypothetical protein [Pseudomonadota bacterium]